MKSDLQSKKKTFSTQQISFQSIDRSINHSTNPSINQTIHQSIRLLDCPKTKSQSQNYFINKDLYLYTAIIRHFIVLKLSCIHQKKVFFLPKMFFKVLVHFLHHLLPLLISHLNRCGSSLGLKLRKISDNIQIN